MRSLAGADFAWNLTNHLLAAQVDALRGGNWQRGGGKGSRPRPVPRPGVGRGTRKYGGKGEANGHTDAEVKALLARAAGRG